MNLLFITWDVDPVAFSLFGLDIAFYGLMWALAFALGLWIFGKIVKHEGLDPEITGSAFTFCIVATVLGARLGHCLFYEPAYYLSRPWEILFIRNGGMASHGAAIGLLIGIWLFSHKWKTPYIWFLDRVGIVVAIGGACIRIGNLINSEVYGTATDMPWGFIFVRANETMPMHPTQIYEALAYILLFAVLMLLYWRTKVSNKRGVMFGVFLIWLFGARFLIESIKNVQEAFETTMKLNMGQWLSIPFVVAGVVILVVALRRAAQPYTNMPQPKAPTRQQKRHAK
ncbi:MAG: prolipoprotein diacylglyceryl transferase [Mucinivorans sp.]